MLVVLVVFAHSMAEANLTGSIESGPSSVASEGLFPIGQNQAV